jgi:hypothetical protein
VWLIFLLVVKLSRISLLANETLGQLGVSLLSSKIMAQYGFCSYWDPTSYGKGCETQPSHPLYFVNAVVLYHGPYRKPSLSCKVRATNCSQSCCLTTYLPQKRCLICTLFANSGMIKLHARFLKTVVLTCEAVTDKKVWYHQLQLQECLRTTTIVGQNLVSYCPVQKLGLATVGNRYFRFCKKRLLS